MLHVEISAQSLAHRFADLIYAWLLSVGLFFPLCTEQEFIARHCSVTLTSPNVSTFFRADFIVTSKSFRIRRLLRFKERLKTYASQNELSPVCFAGPAHVGGPVVHRGHSPVSSNPRRGGRVHSTTAHAGGLGSGPPSKALKCERFMYTQPRHRLVQSLGACRPNGQVS